MFPENFQRHLLGRILFARVRCIPPARAPPRPAPSPTAPFSAHPSPPPALPTFTTPASVPPMHPLLPFGSHVTLT